MVFRPTLGVCSPCKVFRRLEITAAESFHFRDPEVLVDEDNCHWLAKVNWSERVNLFPGTKYLIMWFDVFIVKGHPIAKENRPP